LDELNGIQSMEHEFAIMIQKLGLWKKTWRHPRDWPAWDDTFTSSVGRQWNPFLLYWELRTLWGGFFLLLCVGLWFMCLEITYGMSTSSCEVCVQTYAITIWYQKLDGEWPGNGTTWLRSVLLSRIDVADPIHELSQAWQKIGDERNSLEINSIKKAEWKIPFGFLFGK